MRFINQLLVSILWASQFGSIEASSILNSKRPLARLFDLTNPYTTTAIDPANQCGGSVAVWGDKNGSVFSACQLNSKIIKFTPATDGSYTAITVNTNTQCNSPSALWGDNLGSVYVTCASATNNVLKFSAQADGSYVSSVIASGNDQCNAPDSLWGDASGTIFIGCYSGQPAAATPSVIKYTPNQDGSYVVSAVSTGPECSQPVSISGDASGNLIVACYSGTNSIVQYSPKSDGSYSYSYVDYMLQCTNPHSVWIDAADQVYAACFSGNVMKFTYSAQDALYNGVSISTTSQCDSPSSVWGDALGNLLVSCYSGSNAVAKYAIQSDGTYGFAALAQKTIYETVGGVWGDANGNYFAALGSSVQKYNYAGPATPSPTPYVPVPTTASLTAKPTTAATIPPTTPAPSTSAPTSPTISATTAIPTSPAVNVLTYSSDWSTQNGYTWRFQIIQNYANLGGYEVVVSIDPSSSALSTLKYIIFHSAIDRATNNVQLSTSQASQQTPSGFWFAIRKPTYDCSLSFTFGSSIPNTSAVSQFDSNSFFLSPAQVLTPAATTPSTTSASLPPTTAAASTAPPLTLAPTSAPATASTSIPTLAPTTTATVAPSTSAPTTAISTSSSTAGVTYSSDWFTQNGLTWSFKIVQNYASTGAYQIVVSIATTSSAYDSLAYIILHSTTDGTQEQNVGLDVQQASQQSPAGFWFNFPTPQNGLMLSFTIGARIPNTVAVGQFDSALFTLTASQIITPSEAAASTTAPTSAATSAPTAAPSTASTAATSAPPTTVTVAPTVAPTTAATAASSTDGPVVTYASSFDLNGITWSFQIIQNYANAGGYQVVVPAAASSNVAYIILHTVTDGTNASNVGLNALQASQQNPAGFWFNVAQPQSNLVVSFTIGFTQGAQYDSAPITLTASTVVGAQN